MSEHRKVEITSSNIDLPSSAIAILRSIATAVTLFILAGIGGIALGEKALQQITGDPNAQIFVHSGLLIGAFALLLISIAGIYIVTEKCYKIE